MFTLEFRSKLKDLEDSLFLVFFGLRMRASYMLVLPFTKEHQIEIDDLAEYRYV